MGGRDSGAAGNDAAASNFIRDIINKHNAEGTFDGRVCTRFPPEPNGYLHIGHAKAICLNFTIARDYGGRCHLRFDDTNPSKEETEYIESIQRDVRWLGFDWGEHLYYASDYFPKMYEYALRLIEAGKAYVCDLSPGEIREHRGTLTEPGINSPYRDRSVEENLELFEKMKKGDFPDGTKTLRAKIDMASGNLNMRDPVMYRILHAPHHRTGNEWCIYPMYDWAHGLEDSIEGITHSICTLEFEDHRPLYDWFLDQLGAYHPRQIEFARLNLTYTVMSKRKLLELVKEKYVSGWDDPRMPTLAGFRRRGYTPESIRTFCDRIGVAKSNSTVDIALLDHLLREDLNVRAARVMAVLNPLKVIIDNYPEGQVEWFDAENNPEDASMGSRIIPFSREIYIERDDFAEDPPPKYFRLSPGREVRLKHACYIRCVDVVKDGETGEVTEVHCTYDPESRGGWTEDGRKVKGTSHWVSAAQAIPAEVRMYDNLFTVSNPQDVTAGGSWKDFLNPESKRVLQGCLVEPGLKGSAPGTCYQFLRQGYFVTDPDSTPDLPVFNRSVSLRDTWAKIQKARK